MTLRATDTTTGVQFGVKAVPGSSRDRIAGVYGVVLRICVAAAPERGKANDRICELLATALDLPARSVAVVSGLASPNKQVHVDGLSAQQVCARLGLPG